MSLGAQNIAIQLMLKKKKKIKIKKKIDKAHLLYSNRPIFCIKKKKQNNFIINDNTTFNIFRTKYKLLILRYFSISPQHSKKMCYLATSYTFVIKFTP